MLTAADVRLKRFAVTRFRAGYDQRDVEAFLERAAVALARTDAQGSMTPDEVMWVRFKPSRFSVGYDQDEVDDFLDEIIATLSTTESGTASLGEGRRKSLSAAAVRAKRFAVTRLREGYDQQEVDAFLERAATTLDGPGAACPVTADEVVQVRFSPTKFSAGYDQDEVDDFLDALAATLRLVPGPPQATPGPGNRGWSDPFFGPDHRHLTTDPPQAVRQLGTNGPRLRLWEAQLLTLVQRGHDPVTAVVWLAIYLVAASAATYVAADTAWRLLSSQPSTASAPGPSPWDALWWLAAAFTWLLVSINGRWTAWLLRPRRRDDN